MILYINKYVELVDCVESNKMIKVSGKMNKSKGLIVIFHSLFKEFEEILWIENEISLLNPF